MRLHFRRNYSDLYPRVSCVWEGVERIEPFAQLPKGARAVILGAVYLLWLIGLAAIVLYGELSLLAVVLALLCLPLHELCHALYLLLTRQGVEGIYFFPPRVGHQNPLTRPGAYVMPDICILRREQDVLFRLFPLLWLTVLPALLGLLMPSVASELFFLAVVNGGASCLDLCDAIAVCRLPKDRLLLYPFGTVVPREGRMVFRIIAKRADSEVLILRQLVYADGRCTEVSFAHSESSRVLENEFHEQFSTGRESP